MSHIENQDRVSERALEGSPQRPPSEHATFDGESRLRRLIRASKSLKSHRDVARASKRSLFPLIALMSLLLATYVTFYARHTQSLAYAQLSHAQRRHVRANRELERANDQLVKANQARELLRRAEQSGYGPGTWSSRSLDMHQVSMSRQNFNELLSQTERRKSQIFGAQSFEISLKTSAGSLFETPALADDAGLSVSLRGELFFQLGSSN